jgi:hypothetical protein
MTITNTPQIIEALALVEVIGHELVGGVRRTRRQSIANLFAQLDNSDLNKPQSGFYAGQGGRVQRLADRLFVGGSVAASGQQDGDQGDWLTDFQLDTGRPGGWTQLSTLAAINGDHPENAVTSITGARSKNFVITGLNAIASVDIAVNDNTTKNLSAYAHYAEAYRMPGVPGGAYAQEIDVTNLGDTQNIDPHFQVIGQSIGLQIAAGAELHDLVHSPVSAAINVRSNAAKFLKGIIFGHDAIVGTDGTDGGTGVAIALGLGHKISYFFESLGASWELWPESGEGANGDYFIHTNGIGSVSVQRLKETEGTAWASHNPSVASSSGSLGTHAASCRYQQRGRTVELTLSVAITTNGSASGYITATLPFTSKSDGSFVLAGRENTSGKALQGYIAANSNVVQIFAYDNSYPGGDGNVLVLSGVFQRA